MPRVDKTGTRTLATSAAGGDSKRMPRVASEAAKTVGDKIRQLREGRKWTQEQLAERSQIDPANIRSYETGRSLMNLSSLVRIATALDVEPGFLVEGLTPDMFPERRVSIDPNRPDQEGQL